MGGIYVIGEMTADGHLANISAEVATLARNVAAEGGQEVSGSSSRPIRGRRPKSLPATCRASWRSPNRPPADRPWSMVAAERIAHIVGDDVREFEFVGAGPDGRDLAGALSVTGWGPRQRRRGHGRMAHRWWR